MADNNKNPRRTIWLSETEPLSHYDIWLSKNQHLNSDGEPVVDSGVLRDCDYIFKVWDCDNWHPIVGLNSTDLNKIDTVKNAIYTDSLGERHESYEEFHLPLFTNINSSPAELFDAGTLGEALKKYVSDIEWKLIFEGNNIDINTFIDPAEADKLGGIYADKFQEEDIFFEDFNNHSISLINHANDYWLALAKYKLGYNTSRPEDYNLYISAKDILKIVKLYQHDNPDSPDNYFELWRADSDNLGGIKATAFRSNIPLNELAEASFNDNNPATYNDRLYVWAEDILKAIDNYYDAHQDDDDAPSLPIPWATTTDCGGILADVHRDSPNEAREAGVWVRFVPLNTLLYDVSYNGLSIPEHHLAITGELLIKAINEEMHNHPENPGIDVGGGSTIDPLALYNSFYNSPTVLKGWSNEGQSALKPRFELAGSRMPENRGKVPMLRNDSWWNTHSSSDTNYTEIDNALEWVNLPDNTWRPIQFGGNSITSNNTLNIVAGLNITITPTINGDVTTATISATSTPSPITITEGDGIDVEHTDSEYKIGINTLNATNGQVLSYDETNETVEWVTLQSGTSYTAGTGVLIDQNVIKSEVLVDSNQRIAQLSIKFECGEDYIRTTLDNNTTFPLEPFNYTFIECGNNSDIIVNFTINTQKDCMKGDPVFVELDLSKANSTTVSFGNNMKYIDIGTSITGNSFKDRHVLITMLFGIVKIEGITTISL